MKEYFDLNIEKVLEHWSVSFAVREFISNAFDEQLLTGTKPINVYKEDNIWHIRDYGRGIQSKHFSQNEDQEKLAAKNLIGKFGVGLKDALAVLNRHNTKVQIVSRFSNVCTELYPKGNFGIKTLHAVFDDNVDQTFVGTDIRLFNIDDEVIKEAKSFFLYFTGEKPLEATKNGEIYLPSSTPAIYVNGLQIAQEENFLFSYNITNINTNLKKALNRERSNVGRTAYADSVKSILLKSSEQKVLDYLVKDLKNYVSGNQKDESTWIDVASYAAETLDKTNRYIFVSASAPLDTNQREIAKSTGREIVTLPDNILVKLEKKIFTFDNAIHEYNESFEFDEVSYENLSFSEKNVFNHVKKMRDFFEKYSNLRILPKVTIVKSLGLTILANGVWDGTQIWINRSTLKDERQFIECVSHEFAHSLHNYNDNTREFENDLGEVFSYYGLYVMKNT